MNYFDKILSSYEMQKKIGCWNEHCFLFENK